MPFFDHVRARRPDLERFLWRFERVDDILLGSREERNNLGDVDGMVRVGEIAQQRSGERKTVRDEHPEEAPAEGEATRPTGDRMIAA